MLGNLEKFVFGGPTGTVTILTKENSTYTSKELYLSGAIKQALIDRDELYYIVSTYLNNIEILYRCPPECTHCHFPNNCSAYLPGYALQNGKCLTDSDGPITASKADSSRTTSARSIATGNVEAATWRGQTASSVLTSTSRTAVENALSKIKLYLYWGGFDRCWISSKGEELKRCFLLLTICGCTTTTATNTMGLPSRYSRPSSL